MGIWSGQIFFKILKVVLLVFFFSTPAYSQIYFDYRPGHSLGLSGVSVAAVGDVMLGSWVKPILAEQGLDYPFRKTFPYLEAADLAIANLEAPFTHDTLAFEKRFNFKVPPEYAPSLVTGGFDVVTLANNHMMDFGEGGLVSTLRTLDNLGVQHCGAGMNLAEAHEPAVVVVGGKKLAFFGYSMTFPTEFYAKEDSGGTAYPEPEIMVELLKKWENLVDFTIVSFHWGAEKRQTPKDYQIYFAHLAIDSGADLVLGHHPHVLQGLELYKNRLIAYSLGNFAFGSYSRHAVDSIILQVNLRPDGLLFARCLPINVDNREVEFQPHLLQGDSAKEVINKLQQLSLPLNRDRNIIEDSGLIWGDWFGIYEDWLLNVVVRSFWKTGSVQDFFIQPSDSSANVADSTSTQ